MKFPDDFIKEKHIIIPGVFTWHNPDVPMSIIGGKSRKGFPIVKGDGVTTFEVWDGVEEKIYNDVSIELINTRIKELEKKPEHDPIDDNFMD